MRKLIAIVGPTAVGKSALALELAPQLDGEIINADSRQVYRYMDIGTAKPSPEERRTVPHHLLDIVDPDADFSLALYQQLAYRTIEDIQKRERLPLLVGGTGLYVWAVVEGWQIPPAPPHPDLRRYLEAIAAEEGGLALYRRLQELDPQAASRIDPRNVRRVIRALEVIQRTGQPFSQLQQKAAPPFQSFILGLDTGRADLYHRIDRRVEAMIEKGWIEEVKRLLARGYGLELPAMSGLGYRELGLYLEGRLGLSEATQRIKYQNHRFARHQYAWFRRSDKRIHWLQAGPEASKEAQKLIKGWIAMPGSATL